MIRDVSKKVWWKYLSAPLAMSTDLKPTKPNWRDLRVSADVVSGMWAEGQRRAALACRLPSS